MNWRVSSALPRDGFSVEIVYTPDSLDTTDCSQTAPGGGEIRVPENQLAYDFYRGVRVAFLTHAVAHEGMG